MNIESSHNVFVLTQIVEILNDWFVAKYPHRKAQRLLSV
jgi:hypothetical protein